MRNGMKAITSLIVIAEVLTLLGCAGVQTPSEYAALNGYHRVSLKGWDYYCRLEPVATGSKLNTADCLTVRELNAKVNKINDGRF